MRVMVAALAAGSLAMVIPMASTASAATPVVCLNSTYGKNTSKPVMTGTLLSCSNSAATGGKGTFSSNYSNIKAIKSTIKWNGKGTTTILGTMAVGAKPNKCGTGNRLNITGKVTGGTGAALKGIPKGSPFSMTVCLSPKLVTTQYPGSKIIV
jgi:hypothetical protein